MVVPVALPSLVSSLKMVLSRLMMISPFHLTPSLGTLKLMLSSSINPSVLVSVELVSMNSPTTKLKLLMISGNSYKVSTLVSLNTEVDNCSSPVNLMQDITSPPSVLRSSLKTTLTLSLLVLPSVTVWSLPTNNIPNMLTSLTKTT